MGTRSARRHPRRASPRLRKSNDDLGPLQGDSRMRTRISLRVAIVIAVVGVARPPLALAQTAGNKPASTTMLSLQEAEAMALRNHPLLQAATYDAQAANQVTREAKSAYYPAATANITGAGALPDSRIA